MKRAWRPPVVITVLLVLVTILLLLSRAPDLVVLGNLQDALQDVSLHEAELGRDVLLARAGMNANYESLARDRGHLTADLGRIDATLAVASPRVAARLAQGHGALARATATQLLAVEDFKSENAILRNSLAYLTAEGPLQQEALEARGDPHDFGRLAYAVLQYLKEPSAAVGERIEVLLARIERGPVAPVEFRTFFAHAHKLVEELPAVDVLAAAALDGEALDQAMQFESRVADESRSLSARAQRALYAFYAVAVLLVGYVAMQVRRLRLAALALAAKNRELRAEAGARQRAHERLAARERQLRSITDYAQEAIILVGPDQCIRAWSLGAERLFGVDAEVAVGRPAATLLRGRERPAMTASPRSTHDLDLLGTELQRADGSTFVADLTHSPWRDVDGEHVTVIVRDVSWKRRLREQARQSELQMIQANKMGSLGILLHGKTHAIANPIQTVCQNVDVLAQSWRDMLGVLDRVEQGGEAVHLGGQRWVDMRQWYRTLAQDMHDGVHHVEKLVLELREYGRQSAIRQNAAYDVPALLARTLKLTMHLGEQKPVRMTMEPGGELPAALGDEHDVEQVLVNLICNAVEALDPAEGGEVRLAATWLPARAVIRVSVRDDGPGIAPEVLARIMEPYFTTKLHGSGLGVPISMELLRAQGGQMHYETAPGTGTTVHIDLRENGRCSIAEVLADVVERVAEEPADRARLVLGDAGAVVRVAVDHVGLVTLVVALARQALETPAAAGGVTLSTVTTGVADTVGLEVRAARDWRPNVLALEPAAVAAGIHLCARDGTVTLTLPVAS